jgi:uncharacterized membrane protein YjjP (DUF1212 family)
LLLEYNESTGAIHHALIETARALTPDPCQIAVYYGSIAVSLAEGEAVLLPVHELRYNTALQARVHAILKQVRHGELDAAAALGRLDRVESEISRHSRWLAIVVLGIAAASLACLLGADTGAVIIVGVAAAVGLLARQELARRHFSLLMLPFTAALIGAVLGGLAIRLGWTGTPELVLIVPALMVVPGPHLINGVFDLIDNYLPMSVSRLGLALGILLASGLGVALGVELTLLDPVIAGDGANTERLTLLSDVVLAGLVTCGFAVFYNTAWTHVAMAVGGGMAGHGLRFLALEAGANLPAATFLGGLAVGIMAGWMAYSHKTPVAVIAFAGAVTMIPGLNLYRALAGALYLARTNSAEPNTVAWIVANALHGGLVIGGLALGLILGARTALLLLGERPSPKRPRADREADQAASWRVAEPPVAVGDQP